MDKTVQEAAVLEPQRGAGFNYNKLQAVLCIALSAVVSISLIAWAVSALL